MLAAKQLKTNLTALCQALERRGGAAATLAQEVALLVQQRQQTLAQVETLRAARNQASQAMASLAKDSADFAQERSRLKALSGEVKAAEQALSLAEEALDAKGPYLPNLPHVSVPSGSSEADNPVRRQWGTPPVFSFAPRDHVELGECLGLVDFTRASKLSGARFAFLRRQGAALQRALIRWMLDLHTRQHGYEELWPPVLLRDQALFGTGQLPKFSADVFVAHAGGAAESAQASQPYYLSPTAEVALTGFHADEILPAGSLPRAYVGYAPCFRSEAGSHGQDTRGLIRQHQFDKVELVRLCAPEAGLGELEQLTGHAEAVLQGLGLPYQVVELCTGDLGFAAQKTYDLEVWLPGQGRYREISSCSWCGDFQARRAQIRMRTETGAKPQLLHTLNGSGLAVGRTWVAVLENYQQADGSIVVPEVLRPYMHGVERISLEA
ncbi:MAG: serine--tRNA ligase [Polyangiales bacterium]